MKALLAFALSAVAVSCHGNKQEAPKAPLSPAVLVMVDFSQSAASLLPDYKRYLDEIVGRIPAGGRINVGKIQKATVASFEPFISEVVPGEPGLMDVEEDVRDEQRAVGLRIRRAVDSVFSSPTFSPGTNIISALGLVHDVFPNSDRRVLVLLSDMQHTSSDLDLEKANITDKFIEATLAKLQQAGQLPDLKGVEVYVAGATAKTDERYNSIKKFWLKLFAQAGAEVRSYSRALLNFKL